MSDEKLAYQMKMIAAEKHRQFVKEQTASIMIVLLRGIRDEAEHGKFTMNYGGEAINDPAVRGAVRDRLIEDGFTVEWVANRGVIIIGWEHPRQ